MANRQGSSGKCRVRKSRAARSDASHPAWGNGPSAAMGTPSTRSPPAGPSGPGRPPSAAAAGDVRSNGRGASRCSGPRKCRITHRCRSIAADVVGEAVRGHLGADIGEGGGGDAVGDAAAALPCQGRRQRQQVQVDAEVASSSPAVDSQRAADRVRGAGATARAAHQRVPGLTRVGLRVHPRQVAQRGQAAGQAEAAREGAGLPQTAKRCRPWSVRLRPALHGGDGAADARPAVSALTTVGSTAPRGARFLIRMPGRLARVLRGDPPEPPEAVQASDGSVSRVVRRRRRGPGRRRSRPRRR